MAAAIHAYTIITWNVRGLGLPALRQKIYAYLHRRVAYIAYIQETYIAKGEAVRLQRRWRRQIFATEASAFARGALIWVLPGMPLETSEVKIDKDGCWVLLRGRLN